MSDEELRQLIASNAKAIEALTNTVQSENRRFNQAIENLAYQVQSDNRKLNQAISQMLISQSQMAAAQANFWEIQADYYRRLEEIDERQARMLEILNRYLPPQEGTGNLS